MREEKLDSIRKEIKKLAKARAKYVGRQKRMKELSQDPKVKEYIRLLELNNLEDEIVKGLGFNIPLKDAEEIIIQKKFAKGIEKMPLEETCGVFIFQGKYQMGDRLYNKYHNLEKEMATFILEEENEEFKKANIIIDGTKDKSLYEKAQAEFFKVMYQKGQEEAKRYIKRLYI